PRGNRGGRKGGPPRGQRGARAAAHRTRGGADRLDSKDEQRQDPPPGVPEALSGRRTGGRRAEPARPDRQGTGDGCVVRGHPRVALRSTGGRASPRGGGSPSGSRRTRPSPVAG